MKQGIYWIASYPRSGNTWVRTFWAALDDIRSGRQPSGRQAGVWERKLVTGDMSADTLKQRLSRQSEMASRPGITLLKTHSARMTVDGVPVINPAATAGAVYLVRDPRDVAVSLAAMLKMPIDDAITRMGSSHWVGRGNERFGFEVHGSWSENVRSWKISTDTLVLRYEDLREAPVTHFSTMLSHAGIQVTLMQISQAFEASSLERMQASDRKREAAGQRLRMVRAGQIDQWRSQLSADQAKRLETDQRDEMMAFGYL